MLTYSARKPRGLGDPVSPSAMVVEEAEKARRNAGVAVVVARRRGRESAEFMAGGMVMDVEGGRMSEGRGEMLRRCVDHARMRVVWYGWMESRW